MNLRTLEQNNSAITLREVGAQGPFQIEGLGGRAITVKSI